MNADKKYKILHKKFTQLGLKDQYQIDTLIEQVNSFSNLIIDLYLQNGKSEKRNHLLQGINT